MVNIGNFWQFLAVQNPLSGDQYNATRSNMDIATYKLPALPYAYDVSSFFYFRPSFSVSWSDVMPLSTRCCMPPLPTQYLSPLRDYTVPIPVCLFILCTLPMLINQCQGIGAKYLGSDYGASPRQAPSGICNQPQQGAGSPGRCRN